MRRGRALLLSGLGSILVLLPGCYGKKVLREPVTIEEIAADVNQIRSDQAQTSAGMSEIQTRLQQQADTIQTLKAENQYLWQELESRLLAIDSKLQDVLGQAAGPKENVPYWSGVAPETSNRPPTGTPPPAFGESGRAWSGAPPGSAPAGEPGVTGEPGASSEPGVSPGPGESEPPGEAPDLERPDLPEKTENPQQTGLQAKRVYDQAYLDLTRGNYSLAILGFIEFLRRSPDSDLADNAQYWIGECYYAQDDYRQAIREFQKVLDQYPNGDRVPGALLKLGLSSIQLGKDAEARDYLNQVTDRFPDSEESKLARDKLRSLE